MSLANIRDQQDKPDETIAFAQPALDYYKKFGFVSEETEASTLIVRAELEKGEFKVAQRGSAALLDLATKSNDPVRVLTSEELAGMVFLASEDYSNALSHFQSALTLSRTLKETEEFQTLHCADALWRLGRYSEAEKMLNSVRPAASARAAIAVWMGQVRAGIRLTQKKYADASKLSHEALRAYPNMAATNRFDLLIVSSLADSHSKSTNQALQECQQAMVVAEQQASPYMTARAKMAQAAAYLAAHQPQQAEALADSAHRYFATNMLKESEFFSLYYLFMAYRKSGDSTSATSFSKKALDVYTDFGHTLSSSSYQAYAQRPDVLEIGVSWAPCSNANGRKEKGHEPISCRGWHPHSCRSRRAPSGDL